MNGPEFLIACIIAGIFYMIGHNKGLSEGVEIASGWRDKLIEDLRLRLGEAHVSFNEAIRQRDEARANRIVLPPSPNPFSSKDWN